MIDKVEIQPPQSGRISPFEKKYKSNIELTAIKKLLFAANSKPTKFFVAIKATQNKQLPSKQLLFAAKSKPTKIFLAIKATQNRVTAIKCLRDLYNLNMN